MTKRKTKSAPKKSVKLPVESPVETELPQVDAEQDASTGVEGELVEKEIVETETPNAKEAEVEEVVAEPTPAKKPRTASKKPEPKKEEAEPVSLTRTGRNANQWLSIKRYIEEMGAKCPNTPATAATKQQRFSNALKVLIADEADDAVAIQNIKDLVRLIQDNSGIGEAFDESIFLRNIEETSLTIARRQEFETLYYVLHMVATKRKGLTMDWNMVKRRINPNYAESVLARLFQAANIRIVD